MTAENESAPRGGRVKKEKKISIVFVCTGNTCRSAMAEIITRTAVKKRGLSERFTVSSAGLKIIRSDPLNPTAAEALKIAGYGSRRHTAKVLTRKKAESADLIVCMTPAHKAAIGLPAAYTVAEITGGNDVADPYGLPVEEYTRVLKYLEYAVDDVLELAEKLRAKK